MSRSSKTSIALPYDAIGEGDDGTGSTFIYGGPWIKQRQPDLFLDVITPFNVQLSGTFKKSYAYYSLKERLPTTLTRVIDWGSKMHNSGFASFIAALKHDLVTNKQYAPFTSKGEESEKWNQWIKDQSAKSYYGNNWLFTECYVYRKIMEGAELNGISNLDPFESQKNKAFSGNLEPMCVVAEKMQEFIQPKEEKNDKKDMWVQLCKVSMWANRVDLSISAGEPSTMAEVCPNPVLPFPKPTAKPKPPKKGKPEPVAPPLTDMGYFDPFQVSLDLKPNLLVDDSAKSFDQLFGRYAKLKSAIEKTEAKNAIKFKQTCSCHRLAKEAGMPFRWDPAKPEPDWLDLFPSTKKKKPKEKKPPPPPPGAEPAEPEPPPKNIPCPAKMTVPQEVFFDIVCDNAGYELFTDICIGHYAIAQGLADKIRFHVKKYPWFVSDATRKDFMQLVNACKSASFNKNATIPPPKNPPKVPEGEVAPAPQATNRSITSSAINQLGNTWLEYINNGTFLIMDDAFWTYPHPYKDMKEVDFALYRKLQFSAMIMFKGDLNYRKLLGERCAVPFTPMEPNLEGFLPAPLVALRTIKSDLICGLPKGRYEQMYKFDEKWMEKGNFGMIQMCKKVEKFPKKPDRPCVDYGEACFGEGKCPEHKDF